MRHRRIGIAALAAAVTLAGAAGAEEWPARPVTMVVPFAAGGPVDTLGRILQPHLSDMLGQQVIIENVSGGGGITGSLRVMQAPPDGYMLELGSIGTHAINQSISAKPAYNAATDFAPVILVADAPQVLLVRKDFPASNLKEFLDHLKANHTKLQHGSGGTGTSSHIGCVLLNQQAGVQVTHIPYRGGGPALQDLIAGRIDYICNYISTAVGALEAKQVKALATLTDKRAKALPDIPTADEQGLKGFDVSAWNAIFMPKATPAPIVKQVNEAVSNVLDMPTVQKRLDDIGLIATPPDRRSPDYLGKFVESEIVKWAAPAKASGATAN
jgi:tripartite-type tricarboxylate transporter receptor subunit TctC